ncbi:MAG: MoaD/ThiS family protein [Acidobacteria bacterium]|nr:MoaD/ThiS family protein [Acidobacteriota bacterium]
MGVKVVIPTPLRQYAGKNDSVIVEGSTVDEIMRNLMSRYGELQKHLYTEDGKLRSFVNIYRNDEDIRYLDREKTPVKETDVVSIVPSIAGGSALETGEHGRAWLQPCRTAQQQGGFSR